MDYYQPKGAKYKTQRCVAGPHDIRLEGIADLLSLCEGASVLDVGCNTGSVAYDFFLNRATTIHGCDIFEKGIDSARLWFAQKRRLESRFEVVDLTVPGSLNIFGKDQKYDIVLLLATYHKLKRVMPPDALSELIHDLGNRTIKYFAWRGTSDQTVDNMSEMKALDDLFRPIHLKRLHTSFISDTLGAAAIWARK